uniref:Uncharacterized protein n=1 Tax=Candidatus Kentrum sp. TUN TaxID=2126343 RepID=A0A450ZN01_9GAMM|nr:MAG: hypothetical protein BECKTUN1418F_GA0071002_106414 [Candidatus Kentron sp. TUN]
MQIANPIYDVVFKHLMQNNEIATLILSTILEEEILSLDLLPKGTATALENRSFTAGPPHLNNCLKDCSHSAIIPSSQFAHLFDTQALRLG